MTKDDPIVCPACGAVWIDAIDQMIGWCRACRSFSVPFSKPQSAPVPVILTVGEAHIHLGTVSRGSPSHVAAQLTELLSSIDTRHDWVMLIEMAGLSR